MPPKSTSWKKTVTNKPIKIMLGRRKLNHRNRSLKKDNSTAKMETSTQKQSLRKCLRILMPIWNLTKSKFSASNLPSTKK